jgi:glucan phosphoethanolaminetransferase (alkaline phosphatase superfamily)
MPDVIAAIPSTHRLIVYGALATVATLTAGTTNSAVAIYQGTSGTIIEAVRATYGQEIRKNFRSITVWLWIACLLLVLALLIDIDGSTRHPAGSPDGAQYMFLSALVLVILKFARLAFLQDLFLRANDASNGKRKK